MNNLEEILSRVFDTEGNEVLVSIIDLPIHNFEDIATMVSESDECTLESIAIIVLREALMYDIADYIDNGVENWEVQVDVYKSFGDDKIKVVICTEDCNSIDEKSLDTILSSPKYDVLRNENIDLNIYP